MASFGELLHSVTTASINGVLREHGFTTWAYYVDQDEGQAGVAFANDTSVALYRAVSSDKLALSAFGLAPIADVRYQADKRELVMAYKGSDDWRGIVLFTDASLIDDDEQVSPRLDTTLTDEWRQYLIDRGMRLPDHKHYKLAGRIFLVVLALIVISFAIYILNYKP